MPRATTNRTAPTRGAATVAQEVADRTIARQLAYEGFKKHEVEKLLKKLNKRVIPAILRSWEKGLPKLADGTVRTTVETRKQLRRLTALAREIALQEFGVLSTSFRGTMKELAVTEAKLTAKVLEQELRPFNIGVDAKGKARVLDVILPAESTIASLVETSPMRGRLLKDWFKGLAVGMQQRATTAIMTGVVNGETVSQLRDRLMGATNLSRAHATSTVRTAVNHVSTQARERVYVANDDIVKGVQIVATLDFRTTDICAGLDGRVFPTNQGPRPPFHHQCRTTTIPALKSWKEMGINLKQAPPGTRAALNGQVPANQTFGTWLNNQAKTKAGQERIRKQFGDVKGQLLIDKKITVKSLTDSKQRSRSLKEIQRREGLTEADLRPTKEN